MVSCMNPSTSPPTGKRALDSPKALDQPSAVARFRDVYVIPNGPCPRGGVLQDPVTSDELRPGAVGEVVLGSKGRKRRRDAMRYSQLVR